MKVSIKKLNYLVDSLNCHPHCNVIDTVDITIEEDNQKEYLKITHRNGSDDGYKVYKFESDDDELTLEEVRAYRERQGYPHDNEEWMFQLERKEQVKEAVRNNYDAVDFDRWQQLQNILFKNETDTLDWETSRQIIGLLYEKDINVIDLPE